MAGSNEIRTRLRVDTAMAPLVRRKPLPPTAKVAHTRRQSVLPGSGVHPTKRRPSHDKEKSQTSTETLANEAPIIRLNDYDITEHLSLGLPPNSPLVYGDQIFRALPYGGFHEDADAWSSDGDCVVCIGRDVELRIDSDLILKSNYGALSGRLQKLNDADSADFTAAASYSNAPIRYLLELPPSAPGYHISVRNFFAALRNKPIAGHDLVSALTQLQSTAVDLLETQHNPEKAARFVRRYVQRLKLDDCRYMRAKAIRTLAWCEQTRWPKGWIESFAHCVGMMGNGIEDCDSFQDLSSTTRKLLYRSHRKQQQEVQAMEKIFGDFNVAGKLSSVHPGHAAGLRAVTAFQQFLREYYSQKYGTWPPATEAGGHWLTRTLAQRLQEDFGSLYDLLVDNTVIHGFEQTGEFSYLLCIEQDGTLTPLRRDPRESQFPLQTIIATWDLKCGFRHTPHPWPLLPRLRGIAPTRDSSDNDISMVPALREMHVDSAEEQIDLRNAYLQGIQPDIQLTDFARAFLEHEANTRLQGVNTHDARLGRWLVIHCMMQLLSRVAVDIQGLYYTHGVPYFLNADLKDCPPWPGARIPHTIRQAAVDDSWCWIYAKGIADMRYRETMGEEPGQPRPPRIPTPKFKVEWDGEGRWKLSPAKIKNME